mmetsp:Transcript_25069/g.54204  ORF Transcript_25069/g.54204 Transcript_25069/m.54204 type:complete len:174 (-) Transcript_25069:949-1470(-)
MIQRNNWLLPSSPPLILLACIVIISSAFAFSPSSKKINPPNRIKDSSTSLHHSIKQRLTFNSPPPIRGHGKEPPKLILISGCPGTGKSTFGMSLALEQGILKCISTDTVRAVMRSYVPGSISPPLHRSSYGESFCCFAQEYSSQTIASRIYEDRHANPVRNDYLPLQNSNHGI